MRIESAGDNRNGFFYEASSLHLRNVPAAFTPSVEWSKGGLYPDPGVTPEPPQILSPSLPDQVKIVLISGAQLVSTFNLFIIKFVLIEGFH